MVTIPEFSLYGEALTSIGAEFVHLELIETRSRRYDWEIGTHTHVGLFQVLVLLEGRVEAEVDGSVYHAEGPVALCIPPAVVHGFQFSAESHGFVLTVSESQLFDSTSEAGTLFQPLLAQPAMFDLALQAQAREKIESLLGLLFSELGWPLQGHSLMLGWLVHGILLLLVRLQAGEAGRLEAGGGEKMDLFTRFRRLVEDHYREHWDVPRYAAMLHVEEARLNRLCRKLTQKTAFEIVRDRLMLEARRKLTYVPASISQIAYELGFTDPAYFCRVFRQNNGMTPSQFRQNLDTTVRLSL